MDALLIYLSTKSLCKCPKYYLLTRLPLFRSIWHLKSVRSWWHSSATSKGCGKQITPSLCAFFYHSLRSARIPSEWKRVNVTPVHKNVAWIQLKIAGLSLCYVFSVKLWNAVSVENLQPWFKNSYSILFSMGFYEIVSTLLSFCQFSTPWARAWSKTL